MEKPRTITGYSDQVTLNCERVLVTLLRGLGPWKRSVFLIGGLTPRYLVRERRAGSPRHAGTGDLDLLIDLAVLTDVEAYSTLEGNLKRMGFSRAANADAIPVAWKWKVRMDDGAWIVVDILVDAADPSRRLPQMLPTEGTIAAVPIKHGGIVFDEHDTRDITAELLDGGGRATERVAFANLLSHTVLKAMAYDDRNEWKDAHDLVYCLENADPTQVVALFKAGLAGPHGAAVAEALAILNSRFRDPNPDESYRREGPVATAVFEIDGPANDPDIREQRLLRQRVVADLMGRLLAEVPGGPLQA